MVAFRHAATLLQPRAAVEPERETAPEHLLVVANPEDLPEGAVW